MVAIGFVASWSVISNVFCALLLILTRPFRLDDWIEFPGEPAHGKVRELNLVYTILDDEDGCTYRIPNSLFFQKVIRRRDSEHPIELGSEE
jgi:small-conductance mechanosensitive channel